MINLHPFTLAATAVQMHSPTNRGLGDPDFKERQLVICEPDVTSVELQADIDTFSIQASTPTLCSPLALACERRHTSGDTWYWSLFHTQKYNCHGPVAGNHRGHTRQCRGPIGGTQEGSFRGYSGKEVATCPSPYPYPSSLLPIDATRRRAMACGHTSATSRLWMR